MKASMLTDAQKAFIIKRGKSLTPDGHGSVRFKNPSGPPQLPGLPNDGRRIRVVRWGEGTYSPAKRDLSAACVPAAAPARRTPISRDSLSGDVTAAGVVSEQTGLS